MTSIKFLSLLFFVSFFSLGSSAQESEGDRAYVIQLATYSSWENFAANEQAFYTNTGTADNNIYAEKVGDRVKVYLLDSYQGAVDYFYAGSRLDNVLKTVRNNPNFKGAFRRYDVNFRDLVYYGDAFERYKSKSQDIPSEYNTRGDARIEVPDAVRYTLQLGVFTEQKSPAHLANSYGLSAGEKAKAEKLLSYDFIKVRDKVCRRYFFGTFKSKSAALAKKQELEKNTTRKLLLVKI